MEEVIEEKDKKFESVWGHLPMWCDIEGFRKRVKILERRYGK